MTGVTHARPSAQGDSWPRTPENDGLGDELLFGVAQLRIVVVAIDADEHGVARRRAAVSLIDVFDPDPVVHDQLLTLGFEGSVLKRRDGRSYLSALTQLAKAQDPSDHAGGRRGRDRRSWKRRC